MHDPRRGARDAFRPVWAHDDERHSDVVIHDIARRTFRCTRALDDFHRDDRHLGCLRASSAPEVFSHHRTCARDAPRVIYGA